MAYNGVSYKAGEEPTDTGSFQVTEVDKTNPNKRSYTGLSEDVDKLPKNSKLATGSTALCIDTGDLLMYHNPTKTWYTL